MPSLQFQVLNYDYYFYKCRELPDNILTNEFLPKFDEVSSIKDSQQQGDSLCGLIRQLPPNNKLLVSWLMIHMEHVIEKVSLKSL